LLKESGKAFGQKMIELQRAEWDPLGVDRDLGSQFVNKVEEHFPGDREMAQLKKDFVKCCERTYIAILEMRKPDKLERKKPMPKETIIEFFNACNMKMDLPESFEKLVKYYEMTKQYPNQMIIDWQRELLEVLGFEANHGCTMLSKVGSEFYPGDKDLGQHYSNWRMKAESTLVSAVRMVQAEQAMNGLTGAVPEGSEPPPELKEMAQLRERAEQEIAGLSDEEKSELLAKGKKKIEVFSKLEPENRLEYMSKRSEEEKLQMIKVQMMLVAEMRAQNMCKKDSLESTNAAKEAADAAASSVLPAGAAPTQEQMMM
jgi:hypothetical protein